ncbi:phosphoribosyl-ATP diphosphatase [Geobacter hydrogenophilus]|uniref:Phosphoribosyl-ATP pyrophosphatase n=1 Tax=Geobacter hydrogenophilus TaxID=40983 RepID=A0A9W6LD58_9BACT|nr:phosphoribosyl-ATP diphosphatase [Geobacter hydrogenophilus]MBT0894284.1 phosphoribosyl-ATP diphosphatase [Geobacter hydrogenophilus]GLI38429.1 phosphoribosyl-ATP pyrophosphatase [Geobacter hydrogenophilus]
MSERDDILQAVYQVIQERKNASADSSYTASLLQKGIDKILKKLGEEATEVVIAGKGGKREEIVYETADLFFHALVLLGYYDIAPEEIYAELRRRFGTSGIAEKASRPRE